VLEAIRSIEREEFSLYPDYEEVTRAVERWIGVDKGWVQLTNGLDEGLHVTGERAARESARLGVPGEAIITEPTFEMYAHAAESAGLTVKRILSPADLSFPTDDVLNAVTPATRVIFLTDPANPSGLAMPRGSIATVADHAPHAMILLDEAYTDFSGRTFVGDELFRRRHVVIGRTFAKGHGLAGLRAGALVAHPDTLAPMRALLPPFSVNIVVVRALQAALDDRAYLEWYVGQAAESRQMIYDFATRHRRHYWTSETNFVLVRVGPRATEITRTLERRGILLRDKSGSPRCEGCLRIAAGVVSETREALAALEEFLGE
jgi:histidinol-phosphate aminotransferase